MSNYRPSALTLQTFTKTNKIVFLNYKLTAISAGFGKSTGSVAIVRKVGRDWVPYIKQAMVYLHMKLLFVTLKVRKEQQETKEGIDERKRRRKKYQS